jgi:hypothetical protein
VTRLIHAIQQEEASVVIPWRGNFAYIARLFPNSVADVFCNMIGLSSSMDTFQGKGAIADRIPGIDVIKKK